MSSYITGILYDRHIPRLRGVPTRHPSKSYQRQIPRPGRFQQKFQRKHFFKEKHFSQRTKFFKEKLFCYITSRYCVRVSACPETCTVTFVIRIVTVKLCHCVTVSACPRVYVSRVSLHVTRVTACHACPRVRVSACPRVRVSEDKRRGKGDTTVFFITIYTCMEYSDDTAHSIILCINTVVVKCVFY